MEGKIKLSILGFSFNQTRSGTYGLVLEENHGPRRLMIVIGTPEAQSIAFELQNTIPPRPLSHDLFKSLLLSLNIKLQEVLIYKYEDGIYFSRLILQQGDNNITLESRTSDAIAIALRMEAPIYTYEYIMREQGIVFDESSKKREVNNVGEELDLPIDYSLLNTEELETMLKEAIEGEDYELASLLRDELKRKKKE